MIDRRNFLIGAGAASLAGGGVQAAQPVGQARYAVVGLGTYAVGQILPVVKDCRHTKVTAFVSGTPQKIRDLGPRYGVSRSYSYADFDRIAENDEIDCVYIALPVGLHAEYTIRALKAGKHVLCEKPMASTVAECEAMVAAAQAAGKQLGIAYRVHFEPNNVEAARLAQSGAIGAIRYFSGESGFVADPSYGPHKWRLTKALGGGGSMYDIGIYALNAALMTIGEAPSWVSAVYSTPAGDPRFQEVEGGVEWRLGFPSGIIAQGSSSYTYAYVTRQRVFGSEGGVALDPASSYGGVTGVLQQGSGSRPIRAGDPATQFAAQLDGFSEAALTNRPHRTPGEMGLRDIRIIQAMYRSAGDIGARVTL